MQWLSQNWLWIVFAIGVFLLMRRGGMACGMGHGRSNDGGKESSHHHDANTTLDNQAIDPVDGQGVDPSNAINTMYQGRMYYFASSDNREKFETAPVQYAAAAGGEAAGHRHHRHGC